MSHVTRSFKVPRHPASRPTTTAQQQLPKFRKIAAKMASTDLSQRVLNTLDSASSLPIASAEAFPDVESTILKGALDSLQSREMITYTTEEQEVAVLTEEAEGIVADGSHEVKVYNAVCAALDGLAIKDLPVSHQNTARNGDLES